MEKDIFKQALVDAKKLREAALANAKAALEETLSPRIQEMIRLKLQEEELATEASLEEKTSDMEEGMVDEASADNVDEATLDEILAELEGDTVKEDESLEEAKKKDKEEEKEKEDEKEEEAEEAPEMEAPEVEAPKASEEQEVAELKVDELLNMIRDAVSQAISHQDMQAGGDQDSLELEPVEADDAKLEEINLDSILAEIEQQNEEETLQEADPVNMDIVWQGLAALIGGGTGVAVGFEAAKAGKFGPKLKKAAELVANLGKGAAQGKKIMGQQEEATQVTELKSQLAESVRAINTLKSELNEINLLNAKLLYVNKIFKEKTLSEVQKVKVVDAFDAATSVNEVKKVYESLSKAKQSTILSKRTSLKESAGFASKAMGTAPAGKPIVESNDMINRLQILAGIKQPTF